MARAREALMRHRGYLRQTYQGKPMGHALGYAQGARQG